MRPFLLILLLWTGCRQLQLRPQAGEGYRIRSNIVGDDYTVRVRRPAGYHRDSSYHILYVADGSKGLGQYMLGMDSSCMAQLPPNCLVVTIGHNGDVDSKRRRDFIPASGSKDPGFGQAEKFFRFLQQELLPFIEGKLPKAKSRSFVGHSFSGLFCLYAALQEEQLFTRYFAISPSVWANYGELLRIEEAFAKRHKDLHAQIHMYVGRLEIFNKVLYSTRKFYNRVTARHYGSLKMSMEVIGGTNHFSVRKPAMDKILSYMQATPF